MAGERKKDCKKINLCQMNGNEKTSMWMGEPFA